MANGACHECTVDHHDQHLSIIKRVEMAAVEFRILPALGNTDHIG